MPNSNQVLDQQTKNAIPLDIILPKFRQPRKEMDMWFFNTCLLSDSKCAKYGVIEAGHRF
jgi:hypothetical protein